jgi:hypothetical protein
MNYIFSFVKVLDVKTPIRGTKKSAGIDFLFQKILGNSENYLLSIIILRMLF